MKEMDGIFLSVTGGIGLKETRMSSEETIVLVLRRYSQEADTVDAQGPASLQVLEVVASCRLDGLTRTLVEP
jgi:hypothetical protein